MKNTLLLSLLLTGICPAAFEKWTNKDGKAAELDLVKVEEQGGEKVGEFKMRNGKVISLKISDLSPDSAKKLDAWEAPAAEVEGKPSTFDKMLDGNLVKLQGKSLKKFEQTERPSKYYVFYYTASWCGPCQQFTPSLVEFYNKHKNDKFEIVLVSSDQEESAMEEYAVDKKMPWPQLKLKDAQRFKQKYDHSVTGIPAVIVCDLDGKNLGNYRNLAELEKLVK